MSDDDHDTSETSTASQCVAIVLRPRATMADLIANHPTRGLIVFPLLIGLLTAVPTAFMVEGMFAYNRPAFWVGSIVLSVIGYWMYVYVYGGVYKMIGRWFGSKDGTVAAARLALAWTQVPYIPIGIALALMQTIFSEMFSGSHPTDDVEPIFELGATTLEDIFGTGITVSDIEIGFGEMSSTYWVITLTSYALTLVAFFWSNFLLAEALQCSTWKALLIKLTAFGLHIPIFVGLFVLMVLVMAALIMSGAVPLPT